MSRRKHSETATSMLKLCDTELAWLAGLAMFKEKEKF